MSIDTDARGSGRHEQPALVAVHRFIDRLALVEPSKLVRAQPTASTPLRAIVHGGITDEAV